MQLNTTLQEIVLLLTNVWQAEITTSYRCYSTSVVFLLFITMLCKEYIVWASCKKCSNIEKYCRIPSITYVPSFFKTKSQVILLYTDYIPTRILIKASNISAFTTPEIILITAHVMCTMYFQQMFLEHYVILIIMLPLIKSRVLKFRPCQGIQHIIYCR